LCARYGDALFLELVDSNLNLALRAVAPDMQRRAGSRRESGNGGAGIP
jgi:hypothetical protein